MNPFTFRQLEIQQLRVASFSRTSLCLTWYFKNPSLPLPFQLTNHTDFTDCTDCFMFHLAKRCKILTFSGPGDVIIVLAAVFFQVDIKKRRGAMDIQSWHLSGFSSYLSLVMVTATATAPFVRFVCPLIAFLTLHAA